TLPLSQLINVKELHKHLNGEIIYLLGKVEKNLFVRNLIAHSIPTLIKDKYIVFLSHDISELKKYASMRRGRIINMQKQRERKPY
ncbi:hypothetical protein MWG72_06335, partial [Acinetobacter lwoffii]|nr:hypothetical protein [Acinetobacter lwoffii]